MSVGGWDKQFCGHVELGWSVGLQVQNPIGACVTYVYTRIWKPWASEIVNSYGVLGWEIVNYLPDYFSCPVNGWCCADLHGSNGNDYLKIYSLD